MGAGPSKLRFVAVALMWAAAISLAAAGLMILVFGASVSPLRTLVTSLVVGTFVALLILAKQDTEGFEVEEVEEVRAEAEGFEPERVQHEAAATPGAAAVHQGSVASRSAKGKDADKPRGAPTRRIQ